MKIKSFKLDNKTRDWHLEETVFDNFNLLVGISGVGKTIIINILQEMCQVATGACQLQEVVNWKMDFVHVNQEYQWELKSSEDSIQASITYEKIVKKVDGKNVVLLERSETANRLDSKDIPKLKNTESAISLLSGEESIAPIYGGFQRRFSFTDTRQEWKMASPEKLLEKFKPTPHTGLEEFKEWVMPLPSLIKAYLFHELYPEEFSQIKTEFNNIFPSVKDIKVNVTQLATTYVYFLILQENNRWIPQPQISFGMFRTLIHLIDISLAPRESVIVIDEFENSLGINCMPALTDFVMSKAPYLQFILTSHHPYIISKIPYQTWKLVKRNGGHVRIINATEIPQLQKGSRLNKFIQLTNLPEYEDGIL